MACSDCYPGNSTVLYGEAPVYVTGAGTVGDPFVVHYSGAEYGDRGVAFDYTPAPNLDLSQFPYPVLIRATLTATAGLTLPEWDMGYSGTITLVLTQGGTGSYEVGFAAAGVKSAAAINLSNTVGAKDVVRLLWTGVDWIATDVVLNVS